MTLWKNLKKTHSNIYTLLIAIAVVAVWQGMWGLIGLYVFPEQEVLSYTVSLALGLLLLWLNDFRLDELR